MESSTAAAEPFLIESKYIEDNTSEDWGINPPPGRHNLLRLLYLVSGILVLVFTNTTTYFLFRPTNDYLDAHCASHTSVWSPVVGDKNLKFETVFFNSTLYGSSNSIYRQKPSREVDEAWNALGLDLPPMLLTSEEAVKSGVSLDRVRVEEKDGGPGYPVIVEGFHNIHCLNLLRQALYFNADKYHDWKEGAWSNDEETLQKHIGHCVDMLRIVLMCTADTGVHPFVWAKNSNNGSIPPHVFPDFQRSHKCKNFDTILQQTRKKKALKTSKLTIYPQKDSLILPDWP
ncbi:hypothetical protein OIDMADRAFT_167208 [Oidiodendron maius Zn]|uniref:Tat pathway signal sequence protein n=1 Tax=Oidiodendron maius (strain Zn) TaxID=913774 RepID=A0A0C3CHC5_OIDMZ|nr:hypothetical protein OIDMADRAFT_167208 [Oidiodendron maius Zn]